MLEDIFGVPMSVGTITQSEQATTEVVAEPVVAARACVAEQAVAHVDETSWRQGDKRAWVWVAVTSLVTVFLIRLSRGGHVARELLGGTRSGSENRNHAAACDSSVPAGSRDGGASPRKAAS